jgi:hypothetical protein
MADRMARNIEVYIGRDSRPIERMIKQFYAFHYITMLTTPIIKPLVVKATTFVTDIKRSVILVAFWLAAIALAYSYRTIRQTIRHAPLSIIMICLLNRPQLQAFMIIPLFDFSSICLGLAIKYIESCRKSTAWSLDNVGFSNTNLRVLSDSV